MKAAELTGGVQAIFCFLAGLLLISIWISYEKKRVDKSKDPKRGYDEGLLWLSFALLMWSLVGFWILFTPDIESSKTIHYVRIFSSIINSSFFLIALAYFDYGPLDWKLIQTHLRWRLAIIFTAIVIATVTSFIGSKYLIINAQKVVSVDPKFWIPDNIFSTVTLSIMAYVLYRTFYERNFKLTAYLSSFIIVLTIFTQYVEPFPNILPFNLIYKKEILLISSKVSLMFVFFSLSTSWIYQTENIRESLPKMSISLIGEKGTDNKFPVELTDPEIYDESKRSSMNDVPFGYLLKFCLKRKSNKGYGWLGKDEFDYPNYVARIAKELEIDRVRLFETSRGKYRLRIAPENIHIKIEELNQYPELKVIIRDSRIS